MSLAPPRVVVIGREGQVARALAEVLPHRGLDVLTVARPEIDLLRPDTIGAAIVSRRPDVVVNPAAYTAVDRAEDEPEFAFAINRDGARAVAAAAAEAGAAIVHFSTDYVFDGSKGAPYVETDPTTPLGVYGASKLAGEAAVADANPRHMILRTAWVCSPFGSNFVKTMLRLATERPELNEVADQWGAPTFAHDIANGLATILAKLNDPSIGPEKFGIFHFGSAGETSWHGFAKAIMAASAARGGPSAPVRAIETRDYPTRARRPAYSKLDTGKLARAYGVRLAYWQTSLEPCLDRLVGPRRSTN
jgi:dTDP-4-dehydrorhamnose reductase